MINHIDLPKEVKQFLVIPDNLDDLVPNKNSHYWNTYDLKMFLTDEGITYFKNKGFILQQKAWLFRAPANTETIIHTDVPFKYAINFVLSGHGEMQWVTADGEVERNTFTNGTNFTYTYSRYKSVNSVVINDRWSGDMGLVRTDTFHRVCTGNVDRICLSVRTNDTYVRSFDDVKDLIRV